MKVSMRMKHLNRIIVDSPVIEHNKITYRYKVEGLWTEAFNLDKAFYVEYGNIDIQGVPESIAVIPLIANLLPIAWIYDAEIIVPQCDQTFYDSIPEFKAGYEQMYSMIDFCGQLTVVHLEKNEWNPTGGNAAFFSGGVDAFNTLVCHYDEKPTLLTVWGADVAVDNTDGWNVVFSHLKRTSQDYGVNYATIRSSFRVSINEAVLDKKVRSLGSGDGWWHGFHHGIGINSHAAPVAWAKKLSTIYFASSFTAADKGKVTCASDPTIDNHVKFGSACISHDGYEFTRQMKVHNIVEFAEKSGIPVPLRVCWRSTDGANCCKCEKCWRTMLAIYAEGFDPHRFGFEYSEEQLRALANDMRSGKDPMFGPLRYTAIQNSMKTNCSKEDLPSDIRWFYDANLEQIHHRALICQKLASVKHRLARPITKILQR